MSLMRKAAMFAGLAALVVLTGCGGNAREKMAKEYERLAALPPAAPNHCPYDRALDRLGVAVSENYNFAHKLMKDFVGATENRRAYVGFLNDVAYYVEEEKMEETAAMERVVKEIQAADEKIADPKEKVWPRVVEGINATNALNPVQKLQELAPVAAATLRAIAECEQLKNSFNGFDATTIEKGICAGKIIVQGKEASECIAFLTIQLQRTIKAKYYAK